MEQNIFQGFKVVNLKFSQESRAYSQILWKPHIVRSFNRKKPSSYTLYIINIPSYVTKESLFHMLQRYGPIKNIFLHKHPDSSEPPDIKYPILHPEPHIEGYKVAYVVFKSPESVQNAMARGEEILIASTNKCSISTGIKKWRMEYNAAIPNEEALKDEIKRVMEDYDNWEAERKRVNTEPDEDGWTTVGPASKKQKAPSKTSKTMPSRTRRKKKKVLQNFYPFQRKQTNLQHQANWEELPYLGIDFKTVSAHDTVIWALGGDHQIYVFVYGTSVPIRVCEESYENQRWNPVEGFTSNLLPSDRYKFSSADGLQKRELKETHLPSLAWKWEANWYLQDSFEGKALDKECWTYAVDFPRTYYPTKSWRSCVRRRAWIRYRRYVALDTWSMVEALHKDPAEEPFISVSVGGGEVEGEDADKLMVWAISACSRVFVREGVSATNPEGLRWSFIATPPNQDVTSISVGRTGRVWALTWDGSALVRTGVSRQHPHGVAWARVEPPGVPLKQISAGNGVVWAVSRTGSVHFRKGLDPSVNGDVGSAWMTIAGSFLLFSVGPNDQVWGVIADDYSIVVRTGVTATEPDGKTWKLINLPLQTFDPDRPLFDVGDENIDSTSSEDSQVFTGSTSHMNSNSIEVSCSESRSSVPEEESKCHELVSSLKASSGGETEGGNDQNTSGSTGECNDTSFTKGEDSMDLPCVEMSTLNLRFPDDITSMASSIVSDTPINYFEGDLLSEDEHCDLSIQQHSSSLPVSVPNKQTLTDLDESSCVPQDHDSNSRYTPKSLKKVLSKNSISNSPNSDVFIISGRQGSWAQEESSHFELTFPEEHLWMYVSGSGCWISPNNMPKWFLADYSNYLDKSERWRSSIFDKLKSRRSREYEQFKTYEEAIELRSWVMNGHCRYLVSGQWTSASLELTMVHSNERVKEEATLKIIYTLGSKKVTSILCSSIVLCSLMVDLPAKAVLSLFTPTLPAQPIPLLFSAEKDAEEWLDHLNSVNLNKNKLNKISENTLWALNSNGFIYCHRSLQDSPVPPVTDNSGVVLVDSDTPLPFFTPLDKFGPGSSLNLEMTIYNKALCFRVDLVTSSFEECIAFHFNPRFSDNTIVMNTKEHGVWSYEERNSLKCLSRGSKCRLFIASDDTHLNVFINGNFFHRFQHRIIPTEIRHVYVAGDVVLKNVTYYPSSGDRNNDLKSRLWSGIGGHLRVVEAGAGGVVWGISYDAHVYVYEGSLGGGVFGSGFGDAKFNSMTDIRHFHVWENERWNPLSGFSHKGFPTDRYTWSDKSGRHERTKEGTKLPSRHWQWNGDWVVDYHTPGGVDAAGWQYATDFPMSFHGTRYVTDLVRRRRWLRKARILTSGPWKRMEKVALKSVSVSPKQAEDGSVPVWAVSVSNEVVVREGVSAQCPTGTRWSLISSEMPMKEVCAGVNGGVWAVSVNGLAHMRMGVSSDNPKGEAWINIESPAEPLVQVGSGNGRVWALDASGVLYRRVDVQPLFPEGTKWEVVYDGVSRISVSEDGSLWAVLKSFQVTGSGSHSVSGVIGRRTGVGDLHPAGLGWEVVAGTCWNFVSARTANF